MEKLEMYRTLFRGAFAKPKLSSEKGLETYLELENMESWLKKPLACIYEEGHCQEIFESTKGRYLEIYDPISLLQWGRKMINFYRNELILQVPRSPEEKEDFLKMYSRTETMELLFHMAYQYLDSSETTEDHSILYK